MQTPPNDGWLPGNARWVLLALGLALAAAYAVFVILNLTGLR